MTAGKKPNILMILTDQERSHVDLPSSLSLPGHERLREKSVNFGNFHVTTAPCSPSRSVIYTGQHTKYTRVLGNPGTNFPGTMKPDVRTVGGRLREQGYYTAYKGKWHLSQSMLQPLRRLGSFPDGTNLLEPFGFSDYSRKGDHWGGSWDGFVFDREITSEAGHWLFNDAPRLGKDQPWFLAVNLINPHDIMFYDAGGAQAKTQTIRDVLQPLRTDPDLWPYRDDLGVPLPKSFTDDLSTKPWAQSAFLQMNDTVFGKIGDQEAWYRLQNYYFNCIRDVDQYIAQLLDLLDQSGYADDTIVIFSADHGEMGAAHGLREKGPCMYKENLRVPLSIRHPDIAGGRDTAALASALDIVPTILSLAGVDAKALEEQHSDLKGVDLSPAISQPGGTSERDARGMLYYFGVGVWADPYFVDRIFTNFAKGGMRKVAIDSLMKRSFGPSLDHRAFFRGIHDGRYKFARYFKPTEHHMPESWDDLVAHNDLELYDTENDPDEIVNLAWKPEAHKELILALNAKTNAALKAELYAGDSDDGSEFGRRAAKYSLA